MPSDALVQFNNRIPVAKLKFEEALLQATRESFLQDMVPAAKRASPVLTGHNASTIDATVEPTDAGVAAKLFTASGYGGYLETGTSRMHPRPYIQPAFAENIGKLKERLRAILGRS